MNETKKMKRARSSEMDLTNGNLFWKIPLLALPMAFTTILQLLYTTVDLYTVANYGGGSLSMSAVGSNTALINLIVSVFVNLSLGSNVALGNAKGANDRIKAQKVLDTSVLLSLISGLLVGIIGYFISEPLLKAMDTPVHILANSTLYMQIYFIGMPFLMVYNYGSQMLRALGDSKTPFFVLLISGLINVLLDPIFVIYGKLDVAGVAWATVISEFVSALLVLLWFTFYKKSFVRIRWSRLRMDGDALKDILKIGVPSGIQGLAFGIPNLLIQASLYTITNYTRVAADGAVLAINVDEINAGSSAAQQIENYLYALIDACAAACVSFVGQNYGARKKENIRKTYWYSMIWMLLLWGVATLICVLLADPLLSVLIPKEKTASDGSVVNQANAIYAGKERLYIMALTYGLDGIMDVDGQYLRGMKHSLAPAAITLVGCTGGRILFLYTLFPLSEFHTVFWLYAAFPLSWILVDLVYLPTILILQKHAFESMEHKTLAKPQKAH